MKKSFPCLVVTIFCINLLASCASSRLPSQITNEISTFKLFTMENSPEIGTTMAGQKLFLGGFSGLEYINNQNNELTFYTLTDRGPNGYPTGNERPFLLPDYSPSIVVIKVNENSNTLQLQKTIALKKRDSSPLSGLPNHRLEENPTDIFGHYYSIDADGMDLEGIVSDKINGGWWLADEYAPSLAYFDKNGVLKKRLIPNVDFPKSYAERRTNRGFEGVTAYNQKVWGILQSPLKKENNFTTIVEYNLETLKTSDEYYYEFAKGNDKIGDFIALSENTFLVLEQNGKIGNESQKYVYKITLNGTDKLVTKNLIADLKSTPFNDVEKVEGITVIAPNKIALIYDNDFQIAGKGDVKTGIIPLNDLKNQLLIIELKNNL